MHYLFIDFFLLLLCASVSGHNHIKEDQKGEFLEYDLIGGQKDQVQREILFHGKQIIKTPFKFTGQCYHTTKGAVIGTIKSVESFLHDEEEIAGHQGDFKSVMSDIERSEQFQDYYLHNHLERGQCMFGLPLALWRILKYSLYLAGFRLPRASVHTVKKIFHGGCVCLHG